MRLAVLAVVAACSTSGATHDAQTGGEPAARIAPIQRDAGADAAPDAAPPPPPPIVHASVPTPIELPARPPVDAIPAISASSITGVALTEDGKLAVTVDALGLVRLWPTLDGRREPLAVAIPPVVQVAVTRFGTIVTLATLDRAGTLEFHRLDMSGNAVAASTRIDSERAFVAVIATSEGFVATTDDQTLSMFTVDGASEGVLVPEPGQHVAGVAHRGSAALAILVAGKTVHGRWIVHGTWGTETASLPIDPSHVVISPDLRRAAAQRRGQTGVVLIALDTGKVLDVVKESEQASGAFPLGFIDNTQLAIVDFSTLSWYRNGRLDDATLEAEDRQGLAVMALADHVAVWGRGTSLGLVAPSGTRYLGYKLSYAATVQPIDRGYLLANGAVLVRVDDRFVERERFTLPPELLQLVPIDVHHALALVHTTKLYDLVALDLDEPDRPPTMLRREVSGVQYEVASHLWVTTEAGKVAIGRYDAATGVAEGPVEIAIGTNGVRTTLPQRGPLLIVEEVGAGGEKVFVTKYDAIEFGPKGGPHVASFATKKLEPGFWVTRDDTAAVTSRDGQLSAALAGGRATLRERGGKVRWVAPSRGITQLVWTARGELVGVAGNGMTHLDLATGAFSGPHCGWGFGLYDEVDRIPTSVGPTVCDVRE